MGLLLTIVAIILIVLGVIWLFEGAVLAGLLTIVVGALVGGAGGWGHYGRRRSL